MSAAGEDCWEARMAARAAARRARAITETSPAELPHRDTWPVPPELRGYSARDCFLWYIATGWRQIFGTEEDVQVVFDHDFGYHVLRKGPWQLTLVNLKEFPNSEDRVTSDWPND